jgi:hypothetical protein
MYLFNKYTEYILKRQQSRKYSSFDDDKNERLLLDTE